MTEQFLQMKYLKTHGLFSFFSQRLKRSFEILFKKMINNFKATYIFSNLNMIISSLQFLDLSNPRLNMVF